MATFCAVYLVSGQDDAKIDSWRGRLRKRAEADGGPGALERFDAQSATPAEVVASLQALQLSAGTRYVLAEGVERWRSTELGPLETAVVNMPQDTVLVLIARGKAPASLVSAVEAAGGEVHDYHAPAQRQLPSWVAARAAEQGLQLDRDACKALIACVGSRQKRLVGELEKLRASIHPRTNLSADEVTQLVATEVSVRAYELAGAVVSGEVGRALWIAEELRRAGERPGRLVFLLARRLREVIKASDLLARGHSETQIASELKLAPWIAKQTVADARRADSASLRRAVCILSDLEVELRTGDVDDDAAFSLALAEAAA